MWLSAKEGDWRRGEQCFGLTGKDFVHHSHTKVLNEVVN